MDTYSEPARESPVARDVDEPRIVKKAISYQFNSNLKT